MSTSAARPQTGGFQAKNAALNTRVPARSPSKLRRRKPVAEPKPPPSPFDCPATFDWGNLTSDRFLRFSLAVRWPASFVESPGFRSPALARKCRTTLAWPPEQGLHHVALVIPAPVFSLCALGSQLFGLEQPANLQLAPSRLAQELRRLRAFDRFDEVTLEALGRVDLHRSLRCLEDVLSAAHFHLFPADGAPHGAEEVTSPDRSSSPHAEAPIEPLPRARTREEVAKLLAEAGIAAQLAATSCRTPMGKVLSSKLAITAIYAANYQDAVGAKTAAFRFFAHACALPDASKAVAEARRGMVTTGGKVAPAAPAADAARLAVAQGLLDALCSVGQALASLEPQDINDALPRVVAPGGLALHPCWDLPTRRWSSAPVTLPEPGGKAPTRVVSLTCALDCVVAGTEDGHLRVWSTARPGAPLVADVALAVGEAVLCMCRGAVEEADADEGRMESVQIFAGSGDHRVTAWRLSPGESVRADRMTCVGVLEGHWGWVRCLAFRPSSGLLYSGSGDFTVRCWDPLTAECRHTVKVHNHWVLALALWRNYLFVGSADRSVSMMELEGDGRPVLRHTLTGAHSNHIRSLAVHGGLLFTSSADGTISMWDLHWEPSDASAIDCGPDAAHCTAAPTCVGMLSGHTGRVVALHVASSRLLSADASGEIKVWALDGGPASVRCVQTMRDCWRRNEDGLYCLEAADGRLFFSQGKVKMW